MVTQPDQILEWLCGLCRPTGEADGWHGGGKGWTWLYRGPEWALCLVALGRGCPWKREGGPRSEESQIRVTSPGKVKHKGVQGCVKVRRGVKRCTEGCTRWCASHEGARLAKKRVHMGARKLENGKTGVVGT